MSRGRIAIVIAWAALLPARPASASDADAALDAATGAAVAPAAAYARGQQLAAVCAGCHAPGTAAESVTETFPNIWRLDEPALRQLLLDYREDRGAPTLMNRIAKGYSADELTLIAAAIAASAAEAQP